MVSKCANPDCAAAFRYYHTGKLFRMETASGLERRREMGQDDEKPRRQLVASNSIGSAIIVRLR
jgi:hypothetical protein